MTLLYYFLVWWLVLGTGPILWLMSADFDVDGGEFILALVIGLMGPVFVGCFVPSEYWARLGAFLGRLTAWPSSLLNRFCRLTIIKARKP